jgi:hypothetical protein
VNRHGRAHRQTFTQRRVVFDLMKDRIYYRTGECPLRREIDMGWFDFHCADSIKMRDLGCDDAQDKNDFTDYACDRSYRQVETFLTLHLLKRKDAEARVGRISCCPDSFFCR